MRDAYPPVHVDVANLATLDQFHVWQRYTSLNRMNYATNGAATTLEDTT